MTKTYLYGRVVFESEVKMIVNGIDISDCPFIDNDEKNCPLGCLTENCLYQQKKDLEQENEKLKIQVKHWRETSMSDSQEVENLSEIIEEIIKKFQIDYILDEQTGKRYYRSNKLLDYKEALESIAEIVNEPCNIAEKTCKECKSNCEHKDILNVINRVKDNK